MASTVIIPTGGKEPIEMTATDTTSGAVLTGLTNLYLQIRRISDNFIFDWSDNTFKAGASVINQFQQMNEIDSIYDPGKYNLDTVTHDNGFDTSAITNPNDDDAYHFSVTQTGLPLNAAGLPHTGEIKVGQYIDQLLELGYSVFQSYSYSPQTQVLVGTIWVEQQGLVVTSVLSGSAVWSDENGVELFTMVGIGPDANGFFKVQRSGLVLAGSKYYYSIASLDLAGVGLVSGGKGIFTIG